MSGRRPLPSLDAELEEPRKRLDLRAIRPEASADDATVEENSRKLGGQWGAVTSLTAEKARVAAPPPGPSPVPLASLRIEVPTYLDNELRTKAASLGVTKQFLVLTALRKDGYHIEDVDLVADKRKVRRKA